MSGLYDEDGIDGPFEKGMAKPITMKKGKRYAVRGLWMNGRSGFRTGERPSRSWFEASFDTPERAISKAIQHGLGEGAVREYETETFDV